MNIFGYYRIMILGNNGSGKSFLAGELAAITGLPPVHLDVEFWRPNWEQPSPAEWLQRQTELIAKEKWIIDGNHTGTMELRFQAADLIIFLDINRWACLAGVLKRHGKKRADMPQYLEERLDREFLRFLKGLWNFSKTRKRAILGFHDQYPDKPFLVIQSRREMNRLIRQWRAEKAEHDIRVYGGAFDRDQIM